MRKPYHKCIDCGSPVWTKGGRCRNCYNKYINNNPEKHATFIDGRRNNNKCKDCGKKICYGNLRCKNCHFKYVKENGLKFGKNNSQWKGGLPKCKKCGKILKSYNAIYCKKCLWKIPEIKNKIIKASRKGMKLSPNKPEKLLIKLFQKILPNEYKYNKRLVIAEFVPDFINKKEKKIIELYGCYWHKCPACSFGNGTKRDKRRLIAYNSYGYKTLIIWGHELDNLDKLKDKILKFDRRLKCRI